MAGDHRPPQGHRPGSRRAATRHHRARAARPAGTRRTTGWDDTIRLWDASRALPLKQRQTVAYHYLVGMPYREIAAIVGGSEDAARRAAADGIASLRDGPIDTKEHRPMTDRPVPRPADRMTRPAADRLHRRLEAAASSGGPAGCRLSDHRFTRRDPAAGHDRAGHGPRRLRPGGHRRGAGRAGARASARGSCALRRAWTPRPASWTSTSTAGAARSTCRSTCGSRTASGARC